MAQLMTAADAARILGVVPATVRQMERDGRLTAQRTVGGMRLFCREEVERFAGERRNTSRKSIEIQDQGEDT